MVTVRDAIRVPAHVCPNVIRFRHTLNMSKNTWPRNRYTGLGGGLYTGLGGGLYTGVGGGAYSGVGGGLYTGPGGGLYTGPGGGLYTGPGGGLYTGADSNTYHSNQPPMEALIPYLQELGFRTEASQLAVAHHWDS